MSYGHWVLGNWQTGPLPWRNWQTGVANNARNRQTGAANSSGNWQVRAAPMWNWQTQMVPTGNWQTGIAPLGNWHTGPAPSRNRQTRAGRSVGNWQTGMATMGNWRTGVTNSFGNWLTGLAPEGNWHIGPNHSSWDWQTGLAPDGNWHVGPNHGTWDWQTGLTAEGNWHTGPNYSTWNWQPGPLPLTNWQTGLDYSTFFPFYLAFPLAWDAIGAAQDPWRPLEERMPLSLTGNSQFSTTTSSTSPKCSLQATLELPDQWHMQMPEHEEHPRLTRAEQKAALEKLKKEIYNPLPNRNGDNVGEDVHEKEKEKDQDSETCAICLEDFKPGEEVMLTPCNHMFHEDCIIPWVKSHGQCPICRLQFVRLPLNRNRP